MSYNIEESSSSSASSDADEGWGGVGEVMADEEEQKVLCQALDSFQYVSPVSRLLWHCIFLYTFYFKCQWTSLCGCSSHASVLAYTSFHDGWFSES